MNAVSFEILQFCAEECQRQQTDALAVLRMCKAYDEFLMLGTMREEISQPEIHHLALTIEPDVTRAGYRKVPVFFKVADFAVEPGLIVQAMTSLLKHQAEVTAKEFYQEFERIHPYVDGNGRVGAILYNWKNHTLLHPVTPPEYRP